MVHPNAVVRRLRGLSAWMAALHCCMQCICYALGCSIVAVPEFLLLHPPLPAFPVPLPALQTSNQRKELEDLREMKADVERREKAQAEVIGQQVCRVLGR